MGSKICIVVSRGPSSLCCFCLHPQNSRAKYVGLSISKKCPSVISQSYHKNCVSSYLSNQGSTLWSLTVKSFINTGGSQRRLVKFSMACQGMSMRLSVAKQGILPKINGNRGTKSWPQGCASINSICGILVCCSSSEPVHAETTRDCNNSEDDCDSSYVKFSHGKRVYVDYTIIGIPGDGRCLFRSVAHGACLHSGKPAPSESLQKQLADELRAKVADEFIKRREETEWFIEGDFDIYVSQIRKPYVWGGEPELLIASHVLRMPITVYMHDKDAGGVISMATYGQEYEKDNPINVLYHDFGHYDALQIPGKGGRSRL